MSQYAKIVFYLEFGLNVLHKEGQKLPSPNQPRKQRGIIQRDESKAMSRELLNKTDFSFIIWSFPGCSRKQLTFSYRRIISGGHSCADLAYSVGFFSPRFASSLTSLTPKLLLRVI